MDYKTKYIKYKKKYLHLKKIQIGAASITLSQPKNSNIDFNTLIQNLEKNNNFSVMNRSSQNLGQQNCGIFSHEKYIIKCTSQKLAGEEIMRQISNNPNLVTIYSWNDGIIYKSYKGNTFYIMEKLDGDLTSLILQKIYRKKFNNLNDYQIFFDQLEKTMGGTKKSQKGESLLNSIKEFLRSENGLQFFKQLLMNLQSKLDKLFHNLYLTGYYYIDHKLDNIGYKIKNNELQLFFIDIESGLKLVDDYINDRISRANSIKKKDNIEEIKDKTYFDLNKEEEKIDSKKKKKNEEKIKIINNKISRLREVFFYKDEKFDDDMFDDDMFSVYIFKPEWEDDDETKEYINKIISKLEDERDKLSYDFEFKLVEQEMNIKVHDDMIKEIIKDGHYYYTKDGKIYTKKRAEQFYPEKFSNFWATKKYLEVPRMLFSYGILGQYNLKSILDTPEIKFREHDINYYNNILKNIEGIKILEVNNIWKYNFIHFKIRNQNNSYIIQLFGIHYRFIILDDYEKHYLVPGFNEYFEKKDILFENFNDLLSEIKKI